MVKVIVGKEATLEQSMMASCVVVLKVIPKALAILLTSSVPPTMREVPESTIPYFNPETVVPGTEIESNLTGQ